MSEKSFSEQVQRIPRRFVNGTQYVPMDDVQQIAKEADQTVELLRTEIHELEDARGYWHSRCDDLENAILSPIIFDPSDPRVEIGREYEFSDWYDFRDGPGVGTLGCLEKDSDQPFYFYFKGEGNFPYTFIREVKK